MDSCESGLEFKLRPDERAGCEGVGSLNVEERKLYNEGMFVMLIAEFGDPLVGGQEIAHGRVRNIKPCLRENAVLELRSWPESEWFWHKCSGLSSVRHDANRAGRALVVHRVAVDRLCRCHPQPQRQAQPNRPSRPRLPG